MGIRDFVRNLDEHRERLERAAELLPGERDETLKEAEAMVGMADHAVRSLESTLNNRHVNLQEEHALRFAQDIFLYLRGKEEKVKERLRELAL